MVDPTTTDRSLHAFVAHAVLASVRELLARPQADMGLMASIVSTYSVTTLVQAAFQRVRTAFRVNTEGEANAFSD